MNREELLKNAKPILFNTEMVQAILEGRKTVTRRVIKPQPIAGIRKSVFVPSGIEDGHGREIKLLYKVGDILWVRETWNICNMNYEDNAITFIYKADKSEEESTIRTIVTDKSFEKYERSMAENNPEWRPSIHMSKVAARIFLKVTDVRVERLQDITETQVRKEGFKDYLDLETDTMYPSGYYFKQTWDSTIKKQDIDKYSWGSNPWVWVIEFERVEVENE